MDTNPVSDFEPPQNLPVGPDHMISHFEIGRSVGTTHCRRVALSCLDNLDAVAAYRKFPLLREALVVRTSVDAAIGATDGKIFHNKKNDHIDLWLYREALATAHRRFEIVE